MEACVKYRYLRHRHGLLAGLDAADIGRHMQRPQIHDRFQIVDDLFIHQNRIGKLFAAMQYAVAHCIDLLQ